MLYKLVRISCVRLKLKHGMITVPPRSVTVSTAAFKCSKSNFLVFLLILPGSPYVHSIMDTLLKTFGISVFGT